MCMYCGFDKETETFTTHTVKYGDIIIVITNVPCIQCDKCNEQYYSYSVMKKIEEIVEVAKGALSSIQIIDYAKVA